MGISKWFRGKGMDLAPASVPESPVETPAPAEGVKPERTFTPEEIEQAVIEVLRTVYDPEIPVNIYEMGLVYDVDVDADRRVMIQMTLTSPACPVAGSLVPEIEMKTRCVPGVTESKVILVWDPPWGPEMMSEAAKLQLGIF
jgi:FeS assembly SUF system protein